MSAVDINNISCSIGSSQVLVQASLKINHGSIYCLLGPSVRILKRILLTIMRTQYFTGFILKCPQHRDILLLKCPDWDISFRAGAHTTYLKMIPRILIHMKLLYYLHIRDVEKLRFA